jgi:hypothetical protein
VHHHLRAQGPAAPGIGLGRPETIAVFIPEDTLVPPSIHAVGSAQGTIVFQYGGEWSEFPRSEVIAMETGREAMRHFFSTGELPNAIEWEAD